MEIHINGPPDQLRPHIRQRTSWLPPKAMARAHRSELRRRELMAAEEAEWRRLDLEIADREKADAALSKLAAAFADLLCTEFVLEAGPDLTIEVADGRIEKQEQGRYGKNTRDE